MCWQIACGVVCKLWRRKDGSAKLHRKSFRLRRTLRHEKPSCITIMVSTALAVVFNRSAVIAARQKKKPRKRTLLPSHELMECEMSTVTSADVYISSVVVLVVVVPSSSCRRRHHRRRCRRHRRRLGWLKGVESRARGCRLHKGRIHTIMRVTPCAYPVCGYARKLHAPGDVYSEPRGRIIEKTSPQPALTLTLTRLRARKASCE